MFTMEAGYNSHFVFCPILVLFRYFFYFIFGTYVYNTTTPYFWSLLKLSQLTRKYTLLLHNDFI